MKRTYANEANCRIISDWTIPKMLVIAKKEEKIAQEKLRKKMLRMQLESTSDAGSTERGNALF